MKRIIIAIATLALVAGCATSNSTARQIDRQIKHLESLEKLHEAATDKLAEVGEQIEQGKKDLEALKQEREAEVVEEAISSVN